MGYGFIPVIASIVLAIHHVLITEASPRSKLVVVTVVVVSLAIGRYYSQWMIVATLMQVVVSIYMLLYMRVHGSKGR